jgi:hypothetical protein
MALSIPPDSKPVCPLMIAGDETNHRLPEGMAGAAVSHLAGQHEEQVVVVEVGEDGRAEHDEGAVVRAKGVGVPHAVAGDVNVGHILHAQQPRGEDRELPHVGQLIWADANAVVGGFDPRTANLVGDGARDGVEHGHVVQGVHRLAVLRPQEDSAIELVAREQGTQPSAFRADIVGGV